MSRSYDFPAKREDIDACFDLQQLREWQHRFEQTLNQMESDYGGIENVPERLYKYAKANQLNLKQINYRINKITGPITSAGALKVFHDTVKAVLPNEYNALVQRTKDILGRPDDDWNEMIKYRKH